MWERERERERESQEAEKLRVRKERCSFFLILYNYYKRENKCVVPFTIKYRSVHGVLVSKQW